MSDTVLWEQDGSVGLVTLNRPDNLNAWTAEFGAALRDVIHGPAADESVRAVVITGAGKGFSSGASGSTSIRTASQPARRRPT